MSVRSFLLGFVLLLGSYSSCLAEVSKIAPDLRVAMGDPSFVEAVVQYPDAVTEGDQRAVEALGGTVVCHLHSISGMVVSLAGARLGELAALERVRYVSPNRAVQGFLDVTAAAAGAQQAWNLGLTGKGVTVAVVDSGIADHPDFANSDCTGSRVVYRENFAPDGLEGAVDPYGHGTHVAGIIGGNGRCAPSSLPLRGMAPEVRLISLRALDAEGKGNDACVIAAIDRAIELKEQYGIRVLNLSLGRPVRESYQLDPLGRAVERAWRAGIVVVTAAGNRGRDETAMGYGTIDAPGNHPLVITVGAMRHQNSFLRVRHEIATFSSKGPTLVDHVVKPDLVAAGNRVVSAKARGALLAGGGALQDEYFLELSGTSMAAPVAAGAVALLLEKRVEETPGQVKARLMLTAWRGMAESSEYVDPVTGRVYRNTQDAFAVGAGYVDVGAALDYAGAVRAEMGESAVARVDALNGRVWVEPGLDLWRVLRGVAGVSVLWGDSVLWGETLGRPRGE